MTRRHGRRRKKLLDVLKDRRGYSHLKEEALDRNMWRDLLEEALNMSSDRLLDDDEDKEEDVRSYWMTLRTEEDTLI